MSNRDIYLHVGLPKTATTFLQRKVFPKLPVLYADHKRANFDESLKVKEVHHLHSTSQYAVNDTFESRVEEQLQELFSETEQRKLLISDESLMGGWYINYLSASNIQEMLSQFFPEATILITIRRQDTFLKSLYSTSLTIGSPHTFHQFVNYHDGSFGPYQRISPPNIDVRTLNWNAIIASYERRFGPKNVCVIPFELIRESVGSYLREITSPLDVSFDEPPSTGKQNQSLGQFGLQLTRLRNRLGLANSWFLEDIIESVGPSIIRTLDSLFLSEFEIDEELRTQIMSEHVESNQKLSKRQDLDLGRYGYF